MKRQADGLGGPDQGRDDRQRPRRDDRRQGDRGPPSGPNFGAAPNERPPNELPEDPEIVYEIPIPKKYGGMVIGPGGETAARIRRGAHVQVHVRKQILLGDIQVVELRGTGEQCIKGLAMVQDLINESEAKSEPADKSEKVFKAVANEIVYIHIEIVPAMVGPILGAKGATAKSILQKTGAQIKIGEINPEIGLQTITVSGKMDKAKEAYKTVRTIIGRFDPSRVNFGGPRPDRGRGPMGPPFFDGPPRGGPFPDDFRPPRDQFGRIIRDNNGGGPRPDRGRGPMGPPAFGRRGPEPLLAPFRGGRPEPLLAPYRGGGPLPLPALGEAPPQFLVLQSDGTYKPPAGGVNQQAPLGVAPAGVQAGMGGLASIPGLGAALAALLHQQGGSGQQANVGSSAALAQIAALIGGATGGGAQAANPAWGAQSQGQQQQQMTAPTGSNPYQYPGTGEVSSAAAQLQQQLAAAYGTAATGTTTTGYSTGAPATTGYGTATNGTTGGYGTAAPGTTLYGSSAGTAAYGATAAGTAAMPAGPMAYGTNAAPAGTVSYGTQGSAQQQGGQQQQPWQGGGGQGQQQQQQTAYGKTYGY